MATATAPKVENPKNPTDLNLTPQATEDASSTQQSPSSGGDGNVAKGITEAEVEAVAVKTSDVDGGGAVTDIQKKMKRAERFGMAVHLSEEEKRNSRAERYSIFLLLLDWVYITSNRYIIIRVRVRNMGSLKRLLL